MAENREDLVKQIARMLTAGRTEAQIKEALKGQLETEPLNAGIIRTRQGALMVRVSDDRWPIAMYKKDWNILLSKIPFIEKALDELDILDENPNPKPRVAKAAA